jgi:son of sevenless-like protein
MSVAYASAPNGTSNDSHEEPAVATFFVRALYDYQSTDASSLSFRRGDLIEVLTQLESGWWDGLLDEERGWFPSNYVAVLSDQEAEEELAHRSEMTQSSSSLSTFDEPSTSRPSDASEEESGWPETKASEFWMPHLTTDGQVCLAQSTLFFFFFFLLPCGSTLIA